MAKIGTAQIEIAPHISDDALEQIAQKVADAVERGVHRGMAAAFAPPVKPFTYAGGGLTHPVTMTTNLGSTSE